MGWPVEKLSVELDVPAEMPDGVILRANVIRPLTDEPRPVILARTPYGKDGPLDPVANPLRLARAGYVVVIQDVRGRGTSDGEWIPFANEMPDGHATVDWASRLPGANGTVGMIGASYVGFTQWAAAIDGPPSLKAIVPTLTFADLADGFVFRGGAVELGLLVHWQLEAIGLPLVQRRARVHGSTDRAGTSAVEALVRDIDALAGSNDRAPDGYWSLPVATFAPFTRHRIGKQWLDSIREGRVPSDLTPFADPGVYSRVGAAVLNVGGWYDVFAGGTIRNFMGIQKARDSPTGQTNALLMGPWSHASQTHVVGARDFGLRASANSIDLDGDLTDVTQRWFDRWLKGHEPSWSSDEPICRYFVIGEGRWRTSNAWPPRSQTATFYLQSEGTLADHPAMAKATPTTFVSDQRRPVPTHGGAIHMKEVYAVGPADQAEIDDRSDVAIFTSSEFASDLDIVGHVELRVWVSAEGRSADFVATVCDVEPDGTSWIVVDGIVRVDADPPTAAEVTMREVTVDLWATAYRIRRGHRLRVRVAGSSFPRWDRNPHAGAGTGNEGAARPMIQRVAHDNRHRSRLIVQIAH